MISSTPPTARSIDRRTSSTINNSHEKAQNSALRGASLAFQASHPPPKPLINTYSGSNGALAAATKAGGGRPKNNVRTAVATFQIQTPHIANGMARTHVRPDVPKRAIPDSGDNLKISPSPNSSRQQSPSHIAATLAAARSTPTRSPAQINGTTSGSSSRGLQRTRGQSASAYDRKDESSIPATNALIQLFESRYGLKQVKKHPQLEDKKEIEKLPPLPIQNQRTRHIVSPTPIRPPIPLRLSSHTLSNSTSMFIDRRPGAIIASSNSIHKQPNTVAAMISVQSAGQLPTYPDLRAPDRFMGTAKVPPAVPPPRPIRPPSIDVLKRQTVQSTLDGSDDNSSISSYTSARDMLSRTSTLEVASVPKTITPLEPIRMLPSTVSAPVSPINRCPVVHGRASSRSSVRYTTSRIVPQLTADSLADAIVASSLASSRAPSPSRPITSFPRHQSRPHHLFLPPRLSSRTPSPAKTMRHTLRSASIPSDEDRRKHHHHILKKHPNKHAEGDRKRWRDSITERERKRYEGLWAANKGLLLSDPEFRDCVHALVVKDIWSRSQLAMSTLAEVWQLVNGRSEGMLGRDEFVVGLWLVDQCLKGRKLPVKVGESVWESVRGLRGVKIRSGRARR